MEELKTRQHEMAQPGDKFAAVTASPQTIPTVFDGVIVSSSSDFNIKSKAREAATKESKRMQQRRNNEQTSRHFEAGIKDGGGGDANSTRSKYGGRRLVFRASALNARLKVTGCVMIIGNV